MFLVWTVFVVIRTCFNIHLERAFVTVHKGKVSSSICKVQLAGFEYWFTSIMPWDGSLTPLKWMLQIIERVCFSSCQRGLCSTCRSKYVDEIFMQRWLKMFYWYSRNLQVICSVLNYSKLPGNLTIEKWRLLRLRSQQTMVAITEIEIIFTIELDWYGSSTVQAKCFV